MTRRRSGSRWCPPRGLGSDGAGGGVRSEAAAWRSDWRPPAGDAPDGTGPALSLCWSEGAAGRDQLWGAAARPLPPLSSRSDLEPQEQPRSAC